MQRAFDLTAEIGVAGRVDEIDAHALVGDLRRFGEDRDAAFAFLVVRVHDAVDDLLVSGKCAGTPKKRVDEGGFTVVDVRDESNVATGGHVGGVGRPEG